MRNRLREMAVNLFVKNGKDFKNIYQAAVKKQTEEKEFYTSSEMVEVLTNHPDLTFGAETERPINLSGDTSVRCINNGGTIRTYPQGIGLPPLRWRIEDEQ